MLNEKLGLKKDCNSSNLYTFEERKITETKTGGRLRKKSDEREKKGDLPHVVCVQKWRRCSSSSGLLPWQY